MPLILDLVRHGQALPTGTGGDAVRPLSEAGRDTIRRLADGLARDGWRPGALFTSPLTRARETAAILATACPGLEPTVLLELIPDAEPDEVVGALSERELPPHVTLIGHQPLMGRLAAYLTGGPEPGFSPGAMVRIEFADRLGRKVGVLRLELPPERSR